MGFSLEGLKDVIALSKQGWTLSDIKEVCELLATSPSVDKDAAPAELKKEAENKVIEELPKPADKKEDPIDALKDLIKED